MQTDTTKTGIRTASGVLGGLLGTAALQGAIGLSARVPQLLGMPPMKTDPAEYVVSRVEELSGGRLPHVPRAIAKRAARWLYGVGWAGALTAWAPRLRMNRLGTALAAGAGLGAVTWAAGYLGWLPAAGITRPATREQPSRLATSLLGHVAYGVLSAIPLYAAEKVLPGRTRLA